MKSTEKFLPKCLKPNVSKKINSHEKRPQNRFPKCLKPKKLTFPLKKITLFQESLKIPIKKVYRTVFQNAWSQKNKHSYWKNNSVSKKRINSYEKGPPNRLPKCLKPKKTTLSLKKQFCSKKNINSYEKKATEPSSKMPEAKKTNTFIEKTILFQKIV